MLANIWQILLYKWCYWVTDSGTLLNLYSFSTHYYFIFFTNVSPWSNKKYYVIKMSTKWLELFIFYVENCTYTILNIILN